MNGESFFLANLEILERVIHAISRHLHFRHEEEEDFGSFVKLKLIDNDYRVLRSFREGVNIETFLATVVYRLALDHRVNLWGKWRSSAEARRLGRVAQQLETLISRDEYSLEEAVETLRTNFKVQESPQQLRAIAAELPARRQKRSFVGINTLEKIPSAEDADYTILSRERANRARRMEAALAEALSQLSSEDRRILRMRFGDGLTLAKIASLLNISLRSLYSKMERILRDFRRGIEGAGLRNEDMVDLLAQWEESGVLSDKSPWVLYHDADPPEQVVEVVRNITIELISHVKRNPEQLYSLEPRQFEELIAEILAGYGWRVELTGATRDGGYDIFAISRDASGLETSWLVECKKYKKERKVGVDVVRALCGARLVVPGGMLMLATTSHFSKDALAFKESRYDLQLKDYEAILEWINLYRPNSAGRLYVKNRELVLSKEVYESTPALLERQGADLAKSPEVSDQPKARKAEVNRDVRLTAALAATPAFGAEIANLEILSDSALWNAAQTRMPPEDSERMEELHRKQRLAGLSEVEGEELARLEQQFERVILVRSHSTSLLEKRGHDIRSLIPKLAHGE